jgi:kumamolisin
MATTSHPNIIPGSGQLALQGAVALGPVADEQTLEITVRLRTSPVLAPLDLQPATADTT